VWNAFAGALSGCMRTVAVDLRGHGNSSWDPTGEYRVDSHVADLLKVIEALKLKEISIVGHSLGAALAIRLAAALQSQVTQLVVVDYGPGIPSTAREHARALFREQLRTYRSHEDYVAWLARNRPLTHHAVLAQIAVCALRPRADHGYQLKCDPALAEIGDDHISDRGLIERLRQLECRTLIVRGAGSAYLSRRVLQEMLDAVPLAESAEVPVAGHSVVLDNPAGFFSAVWSFITSDPRQLHAVSAERV